MSDRTSASPVLIAEAYYLRNSIRRQMQVLTIFDDKTCELVRPRQFWGLSEACVQRLILPEVFWQSICDDLLRSEFPDRISGVPWISYNPATVRNLQAIPNGLLKALAFLDEKFGVHLDGRGSNIFDLKEDLGDSSSSNSEEWDMLEREIRRNPSDVQLRLRYANLLIGTHRASFIRTQCELASGEPSRTDALCRFETALLESSDDCRAESITRLGYLARIRGGFVEGVDNIELISNAWSLRDLLEYHPCLAHLGFIGTGDSWSESAIQDLGGLRELQQIKSLSFRNCRLTARQLELWFSRGNLQNLTTLKIGYDEIGDEGVGAIVRSAALHQVSDLSLFGNNMTAKGVVQLVESKMTTLRCLSIGENLIGDEGVSLIASWSGAAQLNTLALSYVDIGPHGAIVLASSTNLQHLSQLIVIGHTVGEEGELALVNAFGDRVFIS